MEELGEKIVGGIVAFFICLFLVCQLAEAVLPEDANAELVDGIKSVGDGVDTVGKAVNDALDGPLKALTDYGERVRKSDSFSKFVHKYGH